MKAIEIMMEEHRYIERMLKVVRKACYKILQGEDIDYDDIKSLRIEAVQKLKSVRPSNIGQASRIAGVSPADISVLHVYLEQMRRKQNE